MRVPKVNNWCEYPDRGRAHSTVACSESEPLLVLLEPHAIVWKCQMRSDENDIYSAIYVGRGLG